MGARLLIYLFIFLIALAGHAKAAGFGVSPSLIEFAVKEGSEASRQLIVYNSGEEAASFSAISSNRGSVAVSPESGAIAGGGTARLTVTALGKRAGVSGEQVVISINNGGKKNEVALSLGTIVAVKLNVLKPEAGSASAFAGILLASSIVLAGLAAYYFVRKKPERFSADFRSAYEIYAARK